MFTRVMVDKSERVAIDHSAHANYNLAFAICNITGVRVNVKCNRIIDGGRKMGFPILVIDRLTLGTEEGEADKADD